MLSDEEEDSSLSELSEEEDFSLTKREKKGRSKKGEFALKKVLKIPRQTTYSTQALYEEIMQGKVDLDPEYQRDVVWTDTKQIGLIDSILRNYYIPSIIFAFSQAEDGEEKRTCIDGKQRLTSIQRFMDGMIPYKDPRSSNKFYYKLQPGTKGTLLPDSYRRAFARKQITCIEYQDITEDEERDIFQRVQLGVALTPAERMQAISGPWPRLVRDILGLMANTKLSDSLEWTTQRGRDFQTIASAVYLLDKSVISVPTASVLDKWLGRMIEPTKSFRNRVMDVFGVFCRLATEEKYAQVFSKPARISPVELLWTALLIDKCMKKCTQDYLVKMIRKMRDDVRSKHDEIRSNTKVVRTLRAFLEGVPPQTLVKGDKYAIDELREETRKDAPDSTTKNSTKRTREDAMSTLSSSDNEGTSKSQKTKVKKTTASGDTSKTGSSISKNGKPGTTANSKSDRLANLRAAKEKAGIGKSTAGAKTIRPKSGTPSSVPQSPPMEQAQLKPTLGGVDMGLVQMIIDRTPKQTPTQTTQQQDQLHWPGTGPGLGVQSAVGTPGAALTQPMQMLQIDPNLAGQVAQQSRPHSASVSRPNMPQPLQLQANATRGASGGPPSAHPFRAPTAQHPPSAGVSPAPTLSPATTFIQPSSRQAQTNSTVNGVQRPEPNANNNSRDNNNNNNNFNNTSSNSNSSMQGSGGAEGRRGSSAGSATPDMPQRLPPPASPRTFHSGGPRFGTSAAAAGSGPGPNDSRSGTKSRFDGPPRSPYLNGHRAREYRDRESSNRDRDSDRERDRERERDSRDSRNDRDSGGGGMYDRPPPYSGGTNRPPPPSSGSSIGGSAQEGRRGLAYGGLPPSGPRYNGGPPPGSGGASEHVNGRNRSRDEREGRDVRDSRDYRVPVGRDGPERRYEDRDRNGNGSWPSSSSWNRR